MENKQENYGDRRYLPHVFTEQGIAMLSGLLKNDIAIQVNIRIMDTSVEMRNFFIANGQLFKDMSMIKGKIIQDHFYFNQICSIIY